VRLLTRYILGEILSHTLIGCVVFTFILFIRDLNHILEMVVRNSSTWMDVFEVFLFTMPNTFKVTIPMAVLVGILLGLSRLAADSEIIAMRASGLGIGYFVRVASIIAVCGTILGLLNSVFVAPRANQAILDLQQTLETSQASYEIQPRVFYEDFRNRVLYVQNVKAGTGASNWDRVFMADVTDPTAPLVTTAASATVVSDSTQDLLMRLRDGNKYDTAAGHPEQYNVSTFKSTDLPLPLSQQGEVHLGRLDTSIYAMPMAALRERSHGPDARRFEIELETRFSYPVACLVLLLVGVPLGAASKRGGRSSGYVFTLVLVIIYYVLSLTGIALARQNKLSAFFGVWMANLVFAAAGTFLLWQMATGGRLLSAIGRWTARLPELQFKPRQHAVALSGFLTRIQPRTTRRGARGAFPRILDEYVIREFLSMFVLVLAGFVLLMLVFTFFDLVGDILRNHISLTTVGAYLVNLTPSMLYQIAPLAVLIAVLVTFGVLNRNSEVVAMKATGISLYRLVVPIVSISAVLSVGMFLFDQYYLPQANRKQESLRSTIKGRPPQTFLQPERKWMFGEPRAGEASRIFYYQFFDPNTVGFANLSVFEFDPATFAITKRIFASRVFWNPKTASWTFRDGWVCTFDGAATTQFQEFKFATFPEVHEQPSYFTKESLQSQEMNFGQLERYIRDLRQSGFDTMRLSVALWRKLAYPLIAIIMSVLAIPFALSMGRRGSLTGVAVAIAVALTYWVIDALFGAMGDVNYLPAALAAWSPDVLFGLTGGYFLLRTST
jgi:LPS export ABC transporter permease LptG/LPS export ABC transporter permease LptF